jgi:hypothetical protein
MGFGAAAAGLLSATAAWLVLRDPRLPRPGLGGPPASLRGPALAALSAALLLAAAWPGWHFELAGTTGRTPEALPFQVLALIAALRFWAGRGERRNLALSAGAALAFAWILSPVALWDAVPAALLLLLAAPGWRRRLAGPALAAAAAAAVLAILALALPGGGEGVAAFLGEQLGGGLGLGPGSDSRADASTSLERPGLLRVLLLAGRALEGGAHNPDLWLRPLLLACIAVAALLAPAALLLRIRRPGAAGDGAVRAGAAGAASAATAEVYAQVPRDPAPALAACALSWLLPLSMLPEDRWFYPLAYRYWGLLLGLGLALLATLCGRSAALAPNRRIFLGSLLPAVLALGLLPSLPRSIIAPPPTRAEAALGAGAHRLDPRPGRPRHSAFHALFPHAPADTRLPMAEGYGLALGADAASSARDDIVPPSDWEELRESLSAGEYRQLLRGVGCGAVAAASDRTLPANLGVVFLGSPPREAALLFLAAEDCGARLPLPPFVDVFADLPRSTVGDPAAEMPPRW